MTETSWPFASGTTAVVEDQWTRMARQWATSGVAGVPGGTALKATGDGTGRWVDVAAGAANVRGHWYETSAPVQVAIDAAPAAPRIDRIVLKLDPAADTITLAVVKGTAAAYPAAPALTQTDTGIYHLALANIWVPAGATVITAGNVFDDRTYASKGVAPAESTRRPDSPVAGQMCYETDTRLTKVFDGASWVNVNAALLPASGSSIVTTDAAGFAWVAYPSGRFASAPVPVMCRGDSGSHATVHAYVCDGAGGVKPAPTAAGFWVGGFYANQTTRINWIAI